MDKVFLEINEKLRRQYEGSSEAWKDSPFAWIRNQPSRRVGKIGEKLVEQWLEERGFTVRASKNSDFDRYVEGGSRVRLSQTGVEGEAVFNADCVV